MSQASAIATMIPSAAKSKADDATLYLPEIHYADENRIPETGLRSSTMTESADRIAQGEYTSVQRVLAMNVAAGECWDASSAVAAVVLGRVLDWHQGVPAWCEDFLERHLGVHNVRSAEHDYRHAA